MSLAREEHEREEDECVGVRIGDDVVVLVAVTVLSRGLVTVLVVPSVSSCVIILSRSLLLLSLS